MEIERDNTVDVLILAATDCDLGASATAQDDPADAAEPVPQESDAGALLAGSEPNDSPELFETTEASAGPIGGEAAPGIETTVQAAETSFCATFYRGFYGDLQMMSAAAAEAHWLKLGKREGRYGHPADVIRYFAAKGVNLPTDFDAEMYGLVNPGLRARLKTELALTAHYMGVGRSAGLQYKPDDPLFVRELYFEDRSSYGQALWAAVRRDEAPFDPTIKDLFARVGVSSTEFLTLFNVSDYICLHPGLGLTNRSQCLHHFAVRGLDALAPIALDYVFEPDFYRLTNGELAALSDQEAYRHWLTTGLARREAPNAARFLQNLGLLETGRFPPGFIPKLYAAANPDLQGRLGSDWRLLQHCVINGIAEARPGCQLSRQTIDLFRAAADKQAVVGSLETARRIYQEVLTLEPRHVMALRHFADCLLRLSDWFNAARVYDDTIRAGFSTIWTYLNLATCYVNMRRWRDAAMVVQQAQRDRSGDLGIQKRLREICRTGFEAQRTEALWLAEEGFAAQARARMKEAVELLALQLPAPALAVGAARPSDGTSGGAKSRKEIRNIAIVADVGLAQCRFYRVDQKVAQLMRLGITVRLFNYTQSLTEFYQNLPSMQAVIFYRVPATPEIVDAIAAVRRAELPSFYEIDDLMFDDRFFPDSFESYGGQITPALYATLVVGTESLKAAMALCDYALASTRALADRMAPFVRSGQAFVHRNAFHAPHEQAMAAPRTRRADDRVRLFYGTGTKAHNEDFEQNLAPALARILTEFPKTQLVVMGYLTLPRALSAFGDLVMLVEPVWDIGAYWRILGRMDINLAVLNPGPVADCKSEIKWLEAAMLGVPSIVTPTKTYADVGVDGETLVFATTAEGWYEALQRLVSDEAERVRIGAAARAVALADYAMPAMARGLRGILDSVTQIPAGGASRKRVLLVNVFFPPQAVGGATRVVADNVADLQRLYGDRLEIEVFTGIEGSAQPYCLSSYVWNGIRVTGVTTPDDPKIDQRLFDDQMGTAFSSCLDRFRPDIIHFHCIQRLTIAICEVARTRGIPYFVTVHDGWWISDTQFLVDSCGALDVYDYAAPMAELARHGVDRFSRMTRLTETLSEAAGVLAVSESFAALYERCGLPRLRVIENGVPAITFAARSPSPSGRVRLAHVGGVSLHKGYNVLKAAVMGAAFTNLEILIVDHALQLGIEQSASWGRTPVRFRGKVPQAEVADLYRDVDVLVAPSVWPESYGLVVREALQAGCWVVTSDRGALSQDVVPGCGHVVPVETYHALQQVLAEIDANPQRYLGPIESRPVLRTAADQAAELGRLYLETAQAASPELPVKPSPRPRHRPRLEIEASL
jgi:glycosyltransferase involved in cell wall biosynthesis/tetratricopeptide (TPR) repeat protein